MEANTLTCECSELEWKNRHKTQRSVANLTQIFIVLLITIQRLQVALFSCPFHQNSTRCTHTETFVFFQLPSPTYLFHLLPFYTDFDHLSFIHKQDINIQKVDRFWSCTDNLFQFQNPSSSFLTLSLHPSTTFSYFHRPVFFIVLFLRTGEYILLPLLVQAVSTTKAPRKILHWKVMFHSGNSA